MKKIKYKKWTIIICILATISITIFLLSRSNQELTNNLTKPVNKERLGLEREKAQEEIIAIIEKSISNKTLIDKYLNQKNNRRITMKELKEELKINISEFEHSKYDCNNEYTTIDYNEDYSQHVISITCNSLLKK